MSSVPSVSSALNDSAFFIEACFRNFFSFFRLKRISDEVDSSFLKAADCFLVELLNAGLAQSALWSTPPFQNLYSRFDSRCIAMGLEHRQQATKGGQSVVCVLRVDTLGSLISVPGIMELLS